MSDGSIYRLIYRSHNRIPTHQRKAQLGEIFSVSRSGNAKKDVTGALLTHDDWFVQALEGDETTVRALYDHIYRDRRHEEVAIVSADTVDARVFSKWAMAQVGEDGDPDIPLLMNVNKGGITPAARRATTPEQDKVLDAMREAVRTQV